MKLNECNYISSTAKPDKIIIADIPILINSNPYKNSSAIYKSTIPDDNNKHYVIFTNEDYDILKYKVRSTRRSLIGDMWCNKISITGNIIEEEISSTPLNKKRKRNSEDDNELNNELDNELGKINSQKLKK